MWPETGDYLKENYRSVLHAGCVVCVVHCMLTSWYHVHGQMFCIEGGAHNLLNIFIALMTIYSVSNEFIKDGYRLVIKQDR